MDRGERREMTVRGADYDARFEARARAGEDVHGEAAFVQSLGVRSVLDAGCGTGRVAVELARRGLDVAGVDADPGMLQRARDKAPELSWLLADLVDVTVPAPGTAGPRRFDAVVMAGNVMIFLAPRTEAEVVANMARHLVPGGFLVAGFQVVPDGLTVDEYDTLCARAGLRPVERFSTWGRAPWHAGSDYVLSVHSSPPG